MTGRRRAATGGVDLGVTAAGIRFPNPVLVASGTFGYGLDYTGIFDPGRLGGIIVKGTTLAPRAGNPAPRLCETPAGLLNAVGLENPGVEAVIAHHLPALAPLGLPVLVNIAGENEAEYEKLAERLTGQPGVRALEVNLSCPNVRKGGMAFGTDPAAVERLTRRLRKRTNLPLFVKLSPNVTDVVEIARAAEAGGADGLSLVNTLLGMAIEVETGRPALGNVTGGLSGPAIRPVAVRMVYQVAQAVKVPILGSGGISTSSDALEFLMAGASLVAVGTALFADPLSPLKIIAGLEEFCRDRGIRRVDRLTGVALPGRGGVAEACRG
ncbi:MAG: dihydroorotate dehydrogenase [Bacillota bacterium]|nr:dihydroorotate dehydrogenase [Bacillota bacterium]